MWASTNCENECLGSEGVSQMWVFYHSGTPIRSFHFSEKKSTQIDDFRFKKIQQNLLAGVLKEGAKELGVSKILL